MRLFFRLLWLFRAYRWWLAAGILLSVITQLGNIALMATSGWFIAAMGLAGLSGASINYFLPAVMIRAFTITRTVGRYAERLVGHEATLRGISGLRVWLFDKIEPLSPEIVQKLHSSDVENRLRTDLNRLETVYLRQLSPFITAFCVAFVMAIWFSRHSFWFASALLFCLFFSGFLIPLSMLAKARKLGRAEVLLSKKLSEIAVDSTQGMSELLAFGATQRQIRRFMRQSAFLIRLQLMSSALSGVAQAGLLLGANLAMWLVMIIAIPMVHDGILSAPDMAMLMLAALAAFESIAPLPLAFLNSGAVAQSARRVFALTDQSIAPRTKRDAEPIPQKLDIICTDLLFSYQDADRPALGPLSFALASGERMGLVGPAGSGKSTLTLLLNGLLSPQAGTILLNGRDLACLPSDAAARFFSVAPQDSSLFSGTIRDCLRLGDPVASDERLWDALETVRMADFVRQLPDGLQSWIGEAGHNISGGQAKRLSIARALIKPAPTLILDEPGEGLDYVTEREMLNRILDGLGERSLILITHRSMGLERMNKIVQLS